MKTLLFIFLFSFSAHSICVHEKNISGFHLLDALHHERASEFHVQVNGRFVPMNKVDKVNPATNYLVQWGHGKNRQKNYDDRYIKYYHYSRIMKFISENEEALDALGHKVEVIGKSIEGRNLYAIYPKQFDAGKKTVLMYGRHHGDEGTANWIIEGFVEKLLSSENFFDRFQLILYPMVNPDGAEAKRRYNSNGYDLNRVWDSNPARSKDEIGIIQTHLKKIYLGKSEEPAIALDMHGSFTRDYIYRVRKTFRDIGFYNLQQSFIDELGSRDPWQAGTFNLSDGDSKMARIYLVRDFGINAMTHETPRDIPKRGSRSIETLKSQGVDVFESIMTLY